MAREKSKPDPIVSVIEALRKRKGLAIVVSAPSGAGKTTVCDKLLAAMPELAMSVSYTTRRPRRGERDGKDYHFVSKKKFENELDKGCFLEWAEVHGYYYGTPRDFLERRIRAGKDTVLDIDVQGAYKISQAVSGAVLILLLPPSLEELERRLRGRRSDKPEDIRKRFWKASREFSCFPRFDYLVINEDIDTAAEQIAAIVKAERCRADRLTH
jgi:guanylate kinase